MLKNWNPTAKTTMKPITTFETVIQLFCGSSSEWTVSPIASLQPSRIRKSVTNGVAKKR